MTKPAPGNYVIVSRVLSCNGQKLAITFCKKGGAVTLTPLTHRQEQIWTISDYSDGQTQYVVPKKDDDLQIAIGGKVAVTLPAGEYVWTIRRGQDGVCIATGDRKLNWGIERGVVDEKICVTKDKGDPRFRWCLEKVRSSDSY
ncbi:hypothetical protein TWF106_003515 [Orbilia oligospora]|uniref:CCL2-like lectin domain-containing protein n=1 Tax=Orbilia oligospora TaxID=2813651 RepID=A0A6G1LXK0_ORBOL|nr:hypothetical protein TWF788_009148 [Orbilia oligospora]KAF3200025.1 hypothetical protein TWF106_003515 [Orbilia oligospora]KAF3205426.1 hypothetical protein TWF191_001846 [Orbilia oligospora]KAF3223870.1 hypothetical protein TWF679_000304 [Orbilia oligospora]KAF3236148.1 hypothetical protein TWF192_011532 [Orbilia oligospora]